MVRPSQSLEKFQAHIHEIYGLHNSRDYSVQDLLLQVHRFVMRALKGIRKKDRKKLRENLMIAFTWMLSVGNKLHINIEEQVWKRFPGVCSYCAFAPCRCKKIHPKHRAKIKAHPAKRPGTMKEFQDMIRSIYPPERRTLAEAGVHLAEETGEVSEAIHNYFGQHQPKQFVAIEAEISDFVSCLFDVANSPGLDLASDLEQRFKNGCHVCHKTPCICTFSEVAAYTS